MRFLHFEMKGFKKGNQENKRYLKIKKKIQDKAFEQTKGIRKKRIDVSKEAFNIGYQLMISKKPDHLQYRDIANYLLAEYPAELGVYIAIAIKETWENTTGHDPYQNIMLAVQYVDRMAGSSFMTDPSFTQEHPLFMQYITETHLPERTKKAIDFLTTGIFQFQDINITREKFPTLITVPEMKRGVKEKLSSIDDVVARYILNE